MKTHTRRGIGVPSDWGSDYDESRLDDIVYQDLVNDMKHDDSLKDAFEKIVQIYEIDGDPGPLTEYEYFSRWRDSHPGKSYTYSDYKDFEKLKDYESAKVFKFTTAERELDKYIRKKYSAKSNVDTIEKYMRKYTEDQLICGGDSKVAIHIEALLADFFNIIFLGMCFPFERKYIDGTWISSVMIKDMKDYNDNYPNLEKDIIKDLRKKITDEKELLKKLKNLYTYPNTTREDILKEANHRYPNYIIKNKFLESDIKAKIAQYSFALFEFENKEEFSGIFTEIILLLTEKLDINESTIVSPLEYAITSIHKKLKVIKKMKNLHRLRSGTVESEQEFLKVYEKLYSMEVFPEKFYWNSSRIFYKIPTYPDPGSEKDKDKKVSAETEDIRKKWFNDIIGDTNDTMEKKLTAEMNKLYSIRDKIIKEIVNQDGEVTMFPQSKKKYYFKYQDRLLSDKAKELPMLKDIIKGLSMDVVKEYAYKNVNTKIVKDILDIIFERGRYPVNKKDFAYPNLPLSFVNRGGIVYLNKHDEKGNAYREDRAFPYNFHDLLGYEFNTYHYYIDILKKKLYTKFKPMVKIPHVICFDSVNTKDSNHPVAKLSERLNDISDKLKLIQENYGTGILELDGTYVEDRINIHIYPQQSVLDNLIAEIDKGINDDMERNGKKRKNKKKNNK